MRSLPFITLVLVSYWPTYEMLKRGYSNQWRYVDGYCPVTTAAWMYIGPKALRREL